MLVYALAAILVTTLTEMVYAQLKGEANKFIAEIRFVRSGKTEFVWLAVIVHFFQRIGFAGL